MALVDALLDKYRYLSWEGQDAGNVAWEYLASIDGYKIKVTAGNRLSINDEVVTYDLPPELYKNIATKVSGEKQITNEILMYLTYTLTEI